MASRVKTLWIKPEYLDQILRRRKTVEVRVAYDNIRRLQPGDELLLNGKHSYELVRVGRYSGFRELLETESATAILPGATADDLLIRLQDIYPRDKEALGVVALEIRPAAAGQ